MRYIDWFLNHAKKHQHIMKKLEHLSDDEIIDYFDFKNMVIYEVEFCLLYSKNRKCHEIESLNCYFCGCLNFRFNENSTFFKNGKKIVSYCSINSPDGEIFETDTVIHQNCTNCDIPHKKEFVKEYFNRNWLECMKFVTV
ncbi:MAG: hypothetical protein HXX81_08060 [Campylobacterales bacterium]|nr:hypothetical protein [Campylobacterales bacterium]